MSAGGWPVIEEGLFVMLPVGQYNNDQKIVPDWTFIDSVAIKKAGTKLMV